MWDKLQAIDEQLFLFINDGMTNGFFDAISVFWRNKYFWFPLYVFLLFFLIYNYKGKSIWLIFIILGVASLADIVSSHIFKEFFERIRPCNDVDFMQQVNLRVGCGSAYSFTSSHAANHMAVGVIAGLILRKFKIAIWIGLLWGLSISITQVYVGVHYPSDVIGGALLGGGIALIIYKLLKPKILLFTQ